MDNKPTVVNDEGSLIVTHSSLLDALTLEDEGVFLTYLQNRLFRLLKDPEREEALEPEELDDQTERAYLIDLTAKANEAYTSNDPTIGTKLISVVCSTLSLVKEDMAWYPHILDIVHAMLDRYLDGHDRVEYVYTLIAKAFNQKAQPSDMMAVFRYAQLEIRNLIPADESPDLETDIVGILHDVHTLLEQHSTTR